MTFQHNSQLPKPMEVIPHRHPHLWLDGVTEATPMEEGRGFWTPGPEHYQGHMGILMGAKQIETCAQLGAYVAMLDSPGSIGVFNSTEFSFTGIVPEGSTLEIVVGDFEAGKRDFRGNAAVFVGENQTASGVIVGSIIPARLAKRMGIPIES
jgi:3-hydroxymyristoyl/3-hydroxydecanoyl-(acyl carrier protein) dehydratase